MWHLKQAAVHEQRAGENCGNHTSKRFVVPFRDVLHFSPPLNMAEPTFVGADITRGGGGGQGGISSRLGSVIAVGEAVTRVSDTIGHP